MVNGTLYDIVNGLLTSFERFKRVFSKPDEFRSFFRRLGWNVNAIPSGYSSVGTAIHTAINNLRAVQNNPNAGLADILPLFIDLENIYQTVKGLTQVPTGIPTADASKFLADLKNYSVYYIYVTHIAARFPKVHSAFTLSGVIRTDFLPASGSRIAHRRIVIDFQRLKNAIQNPAKVLDALFDADKPIFSPTLTEIKAYELLNSLELDTTLADTSLSTDLLLQEKTDRSLDVYYDLFHPFFSFNDSSGILKQIGISFILSKEVSSDRPGLSIIPRLPDGISHHYDIDDGKSLSFRASSDLSKSFLLYISTAEIIARYLGDSMSFSRSGFGVTYSNMPDNPMLIFGSKETTSLELGGYEVDVSVDVHGDEIEAQGSINVKDLSLVFRTSDGDGFIKNILRDNAAIRTTLGIVYSTKTGFHFSGSGGLEVHLNTHMSIGPLSIKNMMLRLSAQAGNPGGIYAEAAAGFSLDIGPINVSVKDIGLRFTMDFSEGNAGPFGIGLSFKPPTGVGIAIEAPPVSGGGFLNYNASTSTYTGALELNFSKISFSAIGIISTKAHDGQGYSLLIIITSTFGPIPLGLGFNLNGLGGILGLHRTMNPDALRSGIRDNTLDNILFPKDVVKNAEAIISGVGAVFPVKKGQFLAGPMAKITWGTPALLTIDLAVVIELPDPVRLSILGILKAIVPDQNNAVLKLQVNFAGVIDFKEKYLSFDASLYDSKLLSAALYGDVALRLYWGSKPAFLMSVGGFHPRFNPPPLNLPSLRRLSIVLANSNNLKIAIESYFAITSSSVQFGAKVAAVAKAWKIEAIGALWFDILFQFKPFYFSAEMGAVFAIKLGNRTLLSIYINLALEGPDPYRARGLGKFSVLGVSVKVSFDKTFGKVRVEAVEPVAIDTRLKDALRDPDNWESMLPERSTRLVGFREEVSDMLSVDPAGALRISQRFMPLNFEIHKFGQAPVRDFKRYDITGVTIGGVAVTVRPVDDFFARNEFVYMSDDDKLGRDGYESFNSGVIAGSEDVVSDYAVHLKCEYEESTIDTGYIRREPVLALSAESMRTHEFGNYINRSAVSAFDSITTSVGPRRAELSMADEVFVIANINNMNRVGSLSFTSSAEAEDYLAAQRAVSPVIARDWLIANLYELD